MDLWTQSRLCCAALGLALCMTACGDGRSDGSYYAENRTYEQFCLADELSLTFEDTLVDMEEPLTGAKPESEQRGPNMTAPETTFRMRVYKQMTLYPEIGETEASGTLKDGTIVDLTEIEDSIWAKVTDPEGKLLGYAKDGFLHAIDPDCAVYAELPVEYGIAKTNEETLVDAYSHLVDIRKYFRVLQSTAGEYPDVDLSQYDIVVCMKLSTNDTSIKEPFYERNLCLLQYDVLQKLRDAVDRFKADGYTIIIYDAYRPSSVQRRWFDVVKVHKWVADPERGMGGVHDRGTAMDMSILDSEGYPVDMPTPMHTFSEASSRWNPNITPEVRANMDYLKEVMVECGFGFINSEWWHFQDVNTKYYLPTDHPLDQIPLMVSEPRLQ